MTTVRKQPVRRTPTGRFTPLTWWQKLLVKVARAAGAR